MRVKLENILTATLVICALITTGLVVYRHLSPVLPPGSATAASQKPVFIGDWKSHLEKGVRLGPADAPVQLIEFADFECPFCASFHTSLKSLRDRYPTQVALSFVHYPLPGHRFAEPAARVAECAGEQGRFESMHDRLYEEQKELGLKPWSEFAVAAAIPDLALFDSCIRSNNPIQRVIEGRQLGEQLDVHGTPTLIVNGWKLSQPPSTEDLNRMVKAVLNGKRPVQDESER